MDRLPHAAGGRVTTLLVDAGRLTANRLEVRDAEHRHLFRARRLGPGERLRVVDGQGAARWGEVLEVSRRVATVALLEPAPTHEPALRLDLLVAAPRPQRASWLIEKATEVGVRRIGLLVSERSPRRYGRGTLERLGRVARSAVEQSERSRLPEISGPHEWSEIATLVTAEERWCLDPEGESGSLRCRPETRSAVLLIGPEGGFTAVEREALGGLGCRSRSLGRRVLRVETAAVVGAGLLLTPGC